MNGVFVLIFFILSSCSDFANDPEPEFGKTGSRNQESVRPGNPLPEDLKNPNEGNFSREKMLFNQGLLLTKSHKEFFLQTQLLATEFEKGCERGSALELLREQYKRTAVSFGNLAAAPIGPLHFRDKFLLDNIYSWPLVNYCGIDREVVNYANSKTRNPKTLFNVKGLPAIEYLLFEPSLSSVCNPRAYPETQSWSQKSAEEKRKDRCLYAKELALELEEHGETLWDDWNPKNGFFAKSLVDGSRYDSLQMAINDLTDHLFQIELIKDHKLGRTLGLHKDCLAAKCPEQAELKFSDLSLAVIHQNLQMLQTLYLGSEDPGEKGFGLDDYLRSLNRADLADRMTTALGLATQTSSQLKNESLQKILQDLDPNLCNQTTREQRLVPVCALFRDVGHISTLMRTEMLSVLGLRPPKIIEGDNDGG